MTTTAILFPGQGSQTPDMRDDVERIRPDLRVVVMSARPGRIQQIVDIDIAHPRDISSPRSAVPTARTPR